ncbi:MAG: ceramidase domain-containing protein [Candidatus Fonsibacter sp.]
MSKSEISFLAGLIILLLLAIFLPAIAQNQNYHNFADQRTFFGIKNVSNTLSNLAFVIVGLWGLINFYKNKYVKISNAFSVLLNLFFITIILTGLGSSYYHLSPNDFTLVFDRLALSLVFAVVLAMLASIRISERSGFHTLAELIILAPLSVLLWNYNGNLTPYAVLQFGGIIIIVLTLLLTNAQKQSPCFASLIILYGFAKLAEFYDVEIFKLSQNLISGHTLKHLIGALAVLIFILPLHKNKIK